MVEKIDLSKQIYSIDLPASTTLEEFLADCYVRPFSASSNGLLWEVVLIYSSKTLQAKESYLAIKIHHCLGDGYTLALMIDILCGKETKYIVQDF